MVETGRRTQNEDENTKRLCAGKARKTGTTRAGDVCFNGRRAAVARLGAAASENAGERSALPQLGLYERRGLNRASTLPLPR